MNWRTKQLIYDFLHPFKKGFWCFINIQKFKIGMLWETWCSYAGDGDYRYESFWTGNRKTTKQLKYYRLIEYDDYDGLVFVVPFFIAYILTIIGTIKHNIYVNKEMSDMHKYCMSLEVEE